MVSLVEHGRIKTTVVKAKELKRHIEKAITLGKKDDLATRRLLMSRIPNETTVNTIVTDISKRFAARPGGYTRVIKIGRRPGDASEMAFIEFVDYDWQAVSGDKAGKTKAGKETKADKEAAKEKTQAVRKKAATTVAKRKSVKKIQKKSRQEARA
jgi:large subunit ribosomal protein L17